MRGWVWATAVLTMASLGCKREPGNGGGTGGGGGPDETPALDAGSGGGSGGDAGFFDAGTRDAGGFDAGGDDAGFTDAGSTDAGEDAGVADAGASDAGGVDGGRLDAGVVVTDGGVGTGPVVYVGSRTHSPIDAALVQHLRGIVARGDGDRGVFAKIGDSISTATAGGAGGGQWSNCFEGAINGPNAWEVNVRLGAYGSLQNTIDFFRTVRLGTESSWTRMSFATRIGAFANWPIAGNPSPMDRELAAINPRYAVVMYGSNDIGAWANPYPLADQLEQYEGNMRAIIDELVSQGVVPLVTTMPPDNDPAWLRFTPAYAGVVRAIAQGRQVPLIDYQRELRALGPPFGLGTDGTHPTCAAWNGCCWFDSNSLRHGYNVRNLITLQALDRMVQVFERGVSSIDSGAERLRGDGTAQNPFVVNDVPFGELRRLSNSSATASGSLSCAGQSAVPLSGPQVLYRLNLSRAMNLRITLLDDGTRAHRMSILPNPNASNCVRTATRLMTVSLPAGTWYLQVNTANGNAATVDYNLSVTECTAGDPECGT